MNVDACKDGTQGNGATQSSPIPVTSWTFFIWGHLILKRSRVFHPVSRLQSGPVWSRKNETLILCIAKVFFLIIKYHSDDEKIINKYFLPC